MHIAYAAGSEGSLPRHSILSKAWPPAAEITQSNPIMIEAGQLHDKAGVGPNHTGKL